MAAATAAPELLPHHAMVPRAGRPGQSYEIRDALDLSVVVTAGEDGVIRPRTALEVRCCDAYRLPAAPGQYVFEPRPGEVERGLIPALPDHETRRLLAQQVAPITPEA